MNEIDLELIGQIKKTNKEYSRIKALLTPLGFTLCTRSVFYGERPFCIYCGEMDDYQSFINNIDSIRDRYHNHKNKSMGIY